MFRVKLLQFLKESWFKMSNKDISLAVLITFIWGINFSVIKLGLGTIDPFFLAALRFFLTAIPLIFFLPKPDVRFSIVILYGLLFGIGLWGMVNLGIYLGVSAGVASLILQFSAYFTIILGFFFFSDKLNKVQLFGMLVSMLGLIVSLVYKDVSASLFALFLVVIAALSMGLCNVIAKKSSPKNMLSFLAWSSLFSPIPLLLIAFTTNKDFALVPALSNIDLLGWFSILFQVYITTLFGYWAWIGLLKKYPISTVAPISLLVPIFGFIGSIILFQEPITLMKLVSTILILLGLVFFIFSYKMQRFIKA